MILIYGLNQLPMKENCGLTELTAVELKEIAGGAFPMLIIRMFIPSIEGILGFRDGLVDGYIRTTPE